MAERPDDHSSEESASVPAGQTRRRGRRRPGEAPVGLALAVLVLLVVAMVIVGITINTGGDGAPTGMATTSAAE